MSKNMPVHLHILKASGRLKDFEARITAAAKEVLTKITPKLALPGVDVVVADNPGSSIPETGVGGFAPTAHVLYVNIDPLHPDLGKNLASEIKSTLTHELHHCARWHAIGYGTTLLEAIVSEGLADHFDMEINGGEPRPWSVAVRGAELEKLQEKAKADFLNEKYSHTTWFFGSEQDAIPRWAGYSLGFSLAGAYMKESGKSASDLVGENAKAFIE